MDIETLMVKLGKYLDTEVEQQCGPAQIAEGVLAVLALMLDSFKEDPLCISEPFWKQVDSFLGSEAVSKLRAAWESGGKQQLIRTSRRMVKSEGKKFRGRSAQELRALDKMKPEYRGVLAEGLRKYEAKRLLDEPNEKVRNDLLGIAIAHRFLGLVPEAAQRASELTQLLVEEACSEEAEQYLKEATGCYLYGLHTACAITCRSVLEEVLERKLAKAKIDQWKKEHLDSEPTLGPLIVLAKGNILPATAIRPVYDVLEIGNRAAHKTPITQQEARTCLKSTREAVSAILRRR